MLKIAIICGGPSLERGISLNSARSLLDHLQSKDKEIFPIYVDSEKRFFKISPYQLYSNTPADFDFKLDETAHHLTDSEFVSYLQSVDLVFPCIHGEFGEDGQLQDIFEKNHIPYIGLSKNSCQMAFIKSHSREILQQNHYPTLAAACLTISKDLLKQIQTFFKEVSPQKVVLKPIKGGSSIGVKIAHSPQEAYDWAQEISHTLNITELLIENYCQGREFTIVVLENLQGTPVSLVPTEIEMDYSDNQIFDYRRKYLPTTNTIYHTPPRFSFSQVLEIRKQSEKIFKLFNMKDFIRMDGWLMDDGTIYFTDFNPISGLEQNSFLFKQAATIGLTHSDILDHLIRICCNNYQLTYNRIPQTQKQEKTPVFVIFGGATAERQVSLMSGTNVWLKLLKSSQYRPIPFLLDLNHAIWKLPYSYALSHTVEEILFHCHHAYSPEYLNLIETIKDTLDISNPLPFENPEKMDLEDFIHQAKVNEAFIFLALHGGFGENGSFQKILDDHDLLYNGSTDEGSRICMDKFLSGQVINALEIPYLSALPKKIVRFSSIFDYQLYWNQLCKAFQSSTFIIKPRTDGCSAGIVKIQNLEDFKKYSNLVLDEVKFIPIGTFDSQADLIEMPLSETTEFLIEPFIQTDLLSIKNQKIIHKKHQGWIELTVGIVEKNEEYHAFNPSITVTEGAVLSLEEKFQGGTGINITPPPLSIISDEKLAKIKKKIEIAAKALSIRNYARIDFFFNIDSEQIIIIEANSLPALTPSTVIFHQALAEFTPLTPLKFLETLIEMKIQSERKLSHV